MGMDGWSGPRCDGVTFPRPHTNDKPEPLAPTGPLSLRRPASTNTNTLRRRMDKNPFHRLWHCRFAISRKNDLELFSAMPCLHPQLENPESFLMAHMKIFQSHNRKVSDYCAKSVVISHVLARRRFLFGDEHKFAAGNQQRCRGTKVLAY